MIGQGRTGKTKDVVVKEAAKEVEAKVKTTLGGFLDFGMRGLSNETKISSKLLEANKGWVYRNNDVIAKEVATIEFELFRVRVAGKDIVYDPVLQSPVLDILDRFNEFTDASSGFYITQSHRKLAGDCFWYLDGNGANIKNIFILPPDKVTINLGKEAGSQRIIESYTYQDTVNGKTIKQIYQPEEIIHFKVPNPKNFYRGLSAVEAAADAIDLDNLSVDANKKLFERGLIAQLMLMTDKALTPEQLKMLHREFQNSYGGSANAFKVPIFGGGIKPETVQMSNKDAQFLEQQEWLRDKIASLFGNNKAVLGVTDDVNRANAEATILDWKRTTIRSEMKGICDTLNEFLVPRFGTNLVLGFKDPVPEDEDSKIEKAKVLKGSDIISLNEAREILSLDPVEGGDEFGFQRTERQREEFVNNNPPAPLKHINLKHILRRSGALAQVEKFKQAKEDARPIAEKMVKSKKSDPIIKAGLNVEKVEAYYAKQMSIIDAVEDIFQDRVEKFINKIVAKALDQVPAEVQNMQKKELFNEDELVNQATIDFTPLLMDVAGASGAAANELIKYDKPYVATDLRATVEDRVQKFARSMVDTDKNKLIDMITDGVRDGQSIPAIRRNITEEFSSYSKMQAERIARTEVLRTSSIASIDAWKKSGLVEGKEWLVSPGADPQCEEYNGKTTTLEGDFYKTSTFKDGNPPLHPNCRCVVLPIVKNEKSVTQEVMIKRLKDELAEKDQYINELEEFVDEEATS